VKSCGECEACCVLIGVRALAKPPGCECIHQSGGKGCSIYAERPDPCRTFNCVWVQGTKLFTGKDRPDKCGVMFVLMGADSAFVKATGLPVVSALEVYPGAFAQYHGERVLRKVSSKLLVMLVPYGGLAEGGGRELIGPAPMKQAAIAWLTSQRSPS